MDALLLLLDICGLVLTSSLVYYATKILFSMGKGMLETSWRFITIGGLVVAVALLTFAIGDSVGLTSFTMYIGYAFALIGILLFVLGLRTQYHIWSMGKREQKESEVKKEESDDIPENRTITVQRAD